MACILSKRCFSGCFQTAHKFFENLGVPCFLLQRCHRHNRSNNFANPANAPNPVAAPLIVRFVSFQNKLTVLKNSSRLCGTSIYMKDDVNQLVEFKQVALRPIVWFLNNKTKSRAVLQGENIKYKEKLYDIKHINDIPVDLSSLGFNVNQSHVMFSGETCPLSNLYHCSIMIDAVQYFSTEQMYQTLKCMAMGKVDIADKVLSSETSREAMVIGKACITSNECKLSSGKDLMKNVIEAKAQQVAEFQELLTKHAGKTFVEATVNPVWGIGLPIYIADIMDTKK